MLGIALLDGVETWLVPAALEAVTVNVYAVPLVRPVNVTLVAVAGTLRLGTAGFEVTV